MHVTLSNAPRSDLPPRGLDRGPDVYPFYDNQLADIYQRLSLPAQSSISNPLNAGQKTWFSFNESSFPSAGWPFASTRIFDQNSEAFPVDQGLLDPEDLGDEITSLLGNVAASQAPRRQQQSSVLKPPPSNVRTRKIRVEVPAATRPILWEWWTSAVLIYNEAIQMVNQANNHGHDSLDNYEMYRLLANEKCPFIQQHHASEQLLHCPALVRRGAVDQAIEARKSLITRHSHGTSPRGIPAIRPIVPSKSKGFVLRFDSRNGQFTPQWVVESEKVRRDEAATFSDARRSQRKQYNPRFLLCKRLLQKRGVPSDLKVRLRGQKNRDWLYTTCKGKDKDKGFYPPREFKLHLDEFGHYNILLFYKVAPSPRPLLLKGDITVLSDDPGI